MSRAFAAVVMAAGGCRSQEAFDRDGDGFVDCRLIDAVHDRNRDDRFGCFDNTARNGPWYAYGAYSADVHDCNDADASIHPTALEEPDGADNDCNGLADDGEGPDDAPADFDGDTYVLFDPEDPASDCDPLDASIAPGAEELCDGLDNDCDGEIDPIDLCGRHTGTVLIGLPSDPGCQCSGRAGRPTPYWLVVTLALANTRRKQRERP